MQEKKEKLVMLDDMKDYQMKGIILRTDMIESAVTLQADNKTGKYVWVRHYKEFTRDGMVYVLKRIEALLYHKHLVFAKPKAWFLDKTKGLVHVVFPEMTAVLEDVLSGKRPDLDWNATKKSICIYGIASAMAYSHNINFPHYNLCPLHILLNSALEPVLWDVDANPCKKFEDIGVQLSLIHYIHLAPESLCDDRPSVKQDVYAFGSLIYQIVTKRNDWKIKGHGIEKSNCFRFFHNIVSGWRFERPSEISDILWQLITACWENRPENRPMFNDIVNVLKSNPEIWALEGTDMDELQAYMNKLE